MAWASGDLPVCAVPGTDAGPRAVCDGAGGAVVAWEDTRNGNYDIYAQRISANGTPMWAVDGVRICAARYDQASPEIVPDGAGGAIVTWPDWRSGNVDIYARRVNADGTPMWNTDGVRLSTSPSSEDSPLIVADGCGGAVVAWVEWHQDTAYDIYAQRVDANGAGGPTPVVFAEASARVENGCVSLSWQVAADVPASSFVVRRADAPDGMFGPVEVSVVRDAGSSFSCVDCSVQMGRTYWYQVVLVGASGEESSGPVEVRVDSAPVVFRAYESYPNPFNPVCTIRYELPVAGRVSLRVFHVAGSVVRVLVDGWREPGVYSEVWDGRGDDGGALPSGVYLYSIEAGEFAATHKMVILK